MKKGELEPWCARIRASRAIITTMIQASFFVCPTGLRAWACCFAGVPHKGFPSSHGVRHGRVARGGDGGPLGACVAYVLSMREWLENFQSSSSPRGSKVFQVPHLVSLLSSKPSKRFVIEKLLYLAE